MRISCSATGRYGGHSQFAAKMRRLLPKACYLGFTGTPLLKKEKNTLSTFGRLIHRYAIDEAVADGAAQGRHWRSPSSRMRRW